MTETAQKTPRHDCDFATTVANFCLRDYSAPESNVRASFPETDLWKSVVAAGTDPWLDTGDIEAIHRLWTKEFTALTTNNTLLNKEVQKGIYDELVPEAAKMLREANPEITEQQVVLEVAFILNAVHGLKLVSHFDADVSVELHTDLANDSEASYQYGKRFAAIEPNRFIVKVPLTPAGLVAARRLSDDGIRINFTLGFSARQNYTIAKLAQPIWCNVFMGRLNAFVKDNGLGDGVNVGEKATLASQRMLRDSGSKTKQIGASIRNGQQVADMIGLDTLTIPTGAAEEFAGSNPNVKDGTSADPSVDLDPSANANQINVFWDVPESFKQKVDTVAIQDFTSGNGDDIREALGDLFPTLTDEDRARVLAESKIPKATSWQSKVDAAEASWDGMLTEAALQSFAADQKDLDDRIRRFL